MPRSFGALALVVLFCSFTAQADSSVTLKSGDFTIQVDVRAQANLIYQLDCLAHIGSCTSNVYEQLWRNELGLDADDKTKLNEWVSIRGTLRESGGDRILPVKASVPITGSDDDLTWTKVQHADFSSPDMIELKRSWLPLMPEASVDRLAAIIAHFGPRFDGWWKQHEPEVVRFLPRIETGLSKAHAAELLSWAARFYRSELDDRRVSVHLFLLPKANWPSSSATVVGADMHIEVDPADNVEDRVPIIIHELSHYLFARMPARWKAQLAEALIQNGRAGVAAWNLFNEVQATVIGNLLAGRNAMSPEGFKKLFDLPRGFYNDDAIDLGARATEEQFAKALKNGVMRASFPKEYFEALRAKLGPLLETPALQLRSMALNVNDRRGHWMRKFRTALRPGAVWDSSPLGTTKFVDRLNRFPGLSAVVVAAPDQVSRLQDAVDVLGVTPEELTAAVGSSSGVVFIAQRTPVAYSYVFLAREEKAVDGLIAAFQHCQLKPGVCVRIE